MTASVFLCFAVFSNVILLNSAEFCASLLYTNDVLCDDGSVLPSNGCCADNGFCPSSCMQGSMSNGVCSCNGCTKAPAIQLTTEEKFEKAHNYFRCRHGQNSVAYSSAVATNAAAAAQGSCSAGRLVHSDSYGATPSAGENLAMGQNSPETAVEDWYNEITSAANGQGYIPGTTSGDNRYSGSAVGHYTALIWGSTTQIGCGICNAGNAPVYACQYANEPANFGGTSGFISNVPQSNAPTSTEDSCCQLVYGSGGGSGSDGGSAPSNGNVTATNNALLVFPGALFLSIILKATLEFTSLQ